MSEELQQEQTQPKQRGGARAGAGRKPVALKNRRLQRAFYLTEAEYKKVVAFIEMMRLGEQ